MFFKSSSELSVEKAFFWLIAVFLYVELDINPFVVEDAVPNSPPTVIFSYNFVMIFHRGKTHNIELPENAIEVSFI